MHRHLVGWCIFLALVATQALATPVGIIQVDNPVFTQCRQLPYDYQRDACHDFFRHLNPDDSQPGLLDYVLPESLRWLTGGTNNQKQFVWLQLVTKPGSLDSLVNQADGRTAFFLDPRYGDYPLEGTIAPHSSFAVVGATAAANVKPTLTLGPYFGHTLFEMFSLELGDSSKTAIFSNLSFNPEYSDGDAPELEFLIQAYTQLDYLVISEVNFHSAGMNGHPLLGLVSINDMRGQVSIVSSDLEISQVKHYGVTINACATGLSEGCRGELLFSENRVTAPGNSGVLNLKNIQDFNIEDTDILMSGATGFVRESPPASLFNLIYSAQPAPVTGFFNINTVNDCSHNFPFSTVVSDTGESISVKGTIYYNNNSYGSCDSVHDNPTLPGLAQLEGLPASLSASLEYVSTTFGLPIGSNPGMPELTTTVAELTRQMVSLSDSSAIAGLSTTNAPWLSPTPTPAFSPGDRSSGYFPGTSVIDPSSSSEWSTTSPAMISHSTSMPPVSSISPSSTGSKSSGIIPGSSQEVPPRSITSVPAIFFLSPSPGASSTPFPGSGSGMPPAVLPRKKKGLSPGVTLGIVSAAVATLAFTGSIYGVVRCVRKFDNPSDITGLWRYGTLGLCVFIVSRRGSSGGPEMNNLLEFGQDKDDDNDL